MNDSLKKWKTLVLGRSRSRKLFWWVTMLPIKKVTFNNKLRVGINLLIQPMDQAIIETFKEYYLITKLSPSLQSSLLCLTKVWKGYPILEFIPICFCISRSNELSWSLNMIWIRWDWKLSIVCSRDNWWSRRWITVERDGWYTLMFVSAWVLDSRIAKKKSWWRKMCHFFLQDGDVRKSSRQKFRLLLQAKRVDWKIVHLRLFRVGGIQPLIKPAIKNYYLLQYKFIYIYIHDSSIKNLLHFPVLADIKAHINLYPAFATLAMSGIKAPLDPVAKLTASALFSSMLKPWWNSPEKVIINLSGFCNI